MNIVIINHYAGSPELGMEYRPYYLAKEWVKMGHEVYIIGASFSHLRHTQPKSKTSSIDGINYFWYKTNKYHGNGIRRIISMFIFVLKLLFNSRKIKKNIRPDIVICSSTYPFDIYSGKLISKLTNAKLIFEVHDLWPLSVIEIGGYSKFHPFIQLIKHAENYAYRKSDKVISLLDKAYVHMEQHGLDHSKFYCIPNGYSAEEWKLLNKKIPSEHKIILQDLKDKNKIIIGYAGGHSHSNALKTLIEAAALINDNRNIVFVLVGKGIQKDYLIDLSNKMFLNNVIFLPPIQKESIPNLISYFNIGYIGGIHSDLHQFGTSPNKLTDYMLGSIPIIYSVDEKFSLVEKVSCGICVPAEDPKQVKQAIEIILSKTREEVNNMGVNGYNYAINNLEYSTLANNFLKVIY